MKDISIRAIAFDATIRAFGVTTSKVLERAILEQGLNPYAAVALGRGLSSAAMLSEMDKGTGIKTTFQVRGDGPMGGVVVVSDGKSILKGYVLNNDYTDYGDNKSIGSLVGKGFLSIIKDMGSGQPYTGVIPLATGEIGEDLALYFTRSEQIPTLVALGVALHPDMTVDISAGLILQAMPGAKDQVIKLLENRMGDIQSFSHFAQTTGDPARMLEHVLGKENMSVLAVKETEYRCDCSEQRMKRGLLALGRKELLSMTGKKELVEVSCHFCNRKYSYHPEELKKCIEGFCD
ncbi:MAG: Hsp33 family molecular chaperone HslO [Clostridia bacterium]